MPTNDDDKAAKRKGPRGRSRNLEHALTLRPREVFELYGIHPSVLSRLVNHEDPVVRLPSILIPGRTGRKGVRLIEHDRLREYLGRFRTLGQ